MGGRARAIVFAVLAAAILVASGAYVAIRAARAKRSVPSPDTSATRARAAIAETPHVLFRSLDLEPSDAFGHLTATTLEPPSAPERAANARLDADAPCMRVHFARRAAADHRVGLCFQADVAPDEHGSTAILRGLDATWAPTWSKPLDGIPSRLRVSPHGIVGAATVFVTGHSYDDASMSTLTILVDMSTGDTIADLESFDVRHGDEKLADGVNLWGVTFAQDDDTFYVTVAAPAALPAPPTGVTVFESAGANAAGIQASVDAFRAAIGGGTTPGAAGSFGGVRREINWDGVPAAKENPFPGDFFNATSPRGVLLSTGGTGLAVSGASGTAGFEFGNVYANGPTEFAPFSSPKLFTALGSTSYDIAFRVAGTQIPAGVSSFGVVFSDVDLANVSKLEFFAADGTLLLTRDVLPTGTAGEGLSFLGVTLPAGTLAAKVRVTTGNVALDAAATTPPGDIVVVDDFIFSEPRALPAAVKTDLFAVGTGPGVEAQVNVFNADASFRFALFPFPGFTGGVNVSTGDVTGDGFEDIAVGAGPGGGPHVRTFDGRTGAEIHSFFAYDESFRGGVFVGLGDATGDLRADLVTGTGVGGGPHVRVFNGQNLAEIHSFFAYDPAFRGGVTVRLGDVSGDGFADVVTGAGVGGGPHVRVFDGRTLTEIQSFFAGDPESRGGVFVGVADFKGTGQFIVTASANGRIFAPGYIEQDNAIPVPTSPGNTRVPVAAIRLDTGTVAILIGAAPGTRSAVRIVDGTSNLTLREFAPFGDSFAGGVFVG
jgi:hypothetical protein